MINPDLDINHLRRAYAQHRILSIPNFLRPDAVQRLQQAVTGLSWNVEIKDYGKSPAFRMPLPPDMARRSLVPLLESVKHGMDMERLFYLRLVVDGEAFSHPDLTAFREFVNSAQYIKTMETITGEGGLTHMSLDATCYDKGCFLGGHRDDAHPQNVIACVFNLTTNWRPDWGGLLMFFEPGMQPLVLRNAWNSLNIFTVPRYHVVSAVSPAASERRYALSGWLRRGAPPAGRTDARSGY
jgi:SM-20-related protein